MTGRNWEALFARVSAATGSDDGLVSVEVDLGLQLIPQLVMF